MLNNSTAEVPKVIHYIWVGTKPLTPLAEKCLASWQKFMPDYELKLWNESNSPMDHHYVKAMYAQKKWAFVSDYIRFWVLNNEGGIYLDTDMELLKPLTDLIKNSPSFIGCSSSGQIESSIIVAPKEAEFIKSALAFYDTDFTYTIANTSPLVLEKAIKATKDNQVTKYDYTYFHPCNEGENCNQSVLAKAYARHHWAESWVPNAKLRKIARRAKVMSILKKIKNNFSK